MTDDKCYDRRMMGMFNRKELVTIFAAIMMGCGYALISHFSQIMRDCLLYTLLFLIWFSIRGK